MSRAKKMPGGGRGSSGPLPHSSPPPSSPGSRRGGGAEGRRRRSLFPGVPSRRPRPPAPPPPIGRGGALDVPKKNASPLAAGELPLIGRGACPGRAAPRGSSAAAATGERRARPALNPRPQGWFGWSPPGLAAASSLGWKERCQSPGGTGGSPGMPAWLQRAFALEKRAALGSVARRAGLTQE